MPAGNVMLTISGVLARDSGKLLTSQPIPLGMALYHSLTNHFRVYLISDDPHAEADHWVLQQGLRGYSNLVAPPEVVLGVDRVTRREQQLGALRRTGANPDLLIDPSPAVVAMAMESGVVGMLFGHPSYARPEFRSDALPVAREWADMAGAVEESHDVRKSYFDDPPDVIGG